MLVEPRMVAAEILEPGERHRREGLVDFIDVNVADRHARLFERAFGREQRFFEHDDRVARGDRDMSSEEHTSELQSLMRISYDVFCLKKKQLTLQPHKTVVPTTNN